MLFLSVAENCLDDLSEKSTVLEPLASLEMSGSVFCLPMLLQSDDQKVMAAERLKNSLTGTFLT